MNEVEAFAPKMSLKTKKMDGLLKPIESQVNKLHDLMSSADDPADVAAVKSLLLSQLSALTEDLNHLETTPGDETSTSTSTYKDTKNRITHLILEFCAMSDKSPKKPPDTSTVPLFLAQLTKAFRTLEDLQYLDLKQQLQDCLNYVKEMGETNEIEDLENIKELGETLLDMLPPLQMYGRGLLSSVLKEKLALFICQLCESYSMLNSIVKQQHEVNLPIFSGKGYICQRMCSCLTMIIDVIDGDGPKDDEDLERIDNFVYKMDLALDLIGELAEKQENQVNECNNLWTAVEDVFSHAMVIAQVCNTENFKAITGVCQTIMEEFDNLKEQISSDNPDPMLNSLFINTFTDALYRLERKINISVLSLVMEAFSEPFASLKKLVKMCGNSLAVEKRSRGDLGDAVEDFDQLTDKVMQIGFYAISCCSDINRVTRIKNHMASLESLETELVPSITSFYLHPDNKEIRENVKIFTFQWQQEMNKLRNAIDLIIDSAAFCQVVLDDLQDRVQRMSDDLDNRQQVTQPQVQVVVQRACTLATQITAAVDDIGRENVDKQTIMMIRELKAAIYETDAASKTLLREKPTEPQQLRVIKRCELIVNVVKRLQPVLAIVMNNSHLKKTSGKFQTSRSGILHEKHNFPSKIDLLPRDEKTSTFTFVKTPYTVKSYKPSVTIKSSTSSREKVDLSCLIPYIEKGRIKRTERTIIMYKTPKTKAVDENKNNANDNANTLRRNLSCVRQHLFSRDSFSDDELNFDCESLNLTGILDKLSAISTSFGGFDDGLRGNLSARDNLSEFSSRGGGNTPSAVDTPERLRDIEKIVKKIECLKADVKG